MQTTLEMIKIIEAFNAGKQIQHMSQIGYDNEWYDCVPSFWNWGYFYYRVKPNAEIAKGFNPKNLTTDEVGVKDGWRLLDEDEFIPCKEDLCLNRKDIQAHTELYCYVTKDWILKGSAIANSGYIYRTKLSRDEFAVLRNKVMSIKATKEIPWTQDLLCKGKIPLPIWVRSKDNANSPMALVTAIGSDFISTTFGTCNYQDLAKFYEWCQTDGKWFPCTQTVNV